MDSDLPTLIYEDFVATRDYVQAVTRIIGALQRLFLEPQAHDWQHGLEVTSYGFQTQSFVINGKPIQTVLNLQTGILSIDDVDWNLQDYTVHELYKNVQIWLEAHHISQPLEALSFDSATVVYDPEQASRLLIAFNWLRRQFAVIKAETDHGLASPILLYPHHFDLSLVWFPQDDERQVSLGFSTGDNVITEPYLYSGAYPLPAQLSQKSLPASAYWNHDSFTAAIVRYEDLIAGPNPAKVVHDFTHTVWGAAEHLLAAGA